MTLKTILIISLSLSIISAASANTKTQVSSENVSKALMTKETQKNVSWSGFVVQITNHENDTCYQLIEAKSKDIRKGKPSYKLLSNTSKFVACQNKNNDFAQYKNRFVRVSGDIVSYIKLTDIGQDMPVLEIKSLKTIPSLRKIMKKQSERTYVYAGGSVPSK